MRLVAVRFEDFHNGRKVLKGVTGKVARQLVCLDNTRLYDLLQPNEPYVRRKEDEVSLVDFMFSDVGVTSQVENFQEVTVRDLTEDKSVCGVALDLEKYFERVQELETLQIPIFIYVDCRGIGVDRLVNHILGLRDKVGKEVFLVCDVDLSLMEYKSVEDELDSKEKSTRIRLVGKTIFKLCGVSYGGMFPRWFVKKYKLDFNYAFLHDVTQVAILAEDFDYVDLNQDKVYSYNKIVEKG